MWLTADMIGELGSSFGSVFWICVAYDRSSETAELETLALAACVGRRAPRRRRGGDLPAESVALGARRLGVEPHRLGGSRSLAAQSIIGVKLDALARAQRPEIRRGRYHRRWTGSRRHTASTQATRRARRARNFLLHRRACATVSGSRSRDRAAGARGGKSQPAPPAQFLAAGASCHERRDLPRPGNHIPSNRKCPAVFPRPGRPAQSFSGPHPHSPGAAARQLDPARLRYGERGFGGGFSQAVHAAARRRYFIAARRTRGTHPERRPSDSGSAASAARRAAGRRADARDLARGIAMIPARPLVLSEFTAASCIGKGAAATLASLAAHRSGLKHCDFETVKIDTHIGEVEGVDAERLPAALKNFDCRNNRLAELAVRQDGFADAVAAAAARWGRRRVGVFIGPSTSGIMQTELAYPGRDPASGALPQNL